MIKKIICLIFILFPCAAFAYGEPPISEGYKYIIDALTGATGITLATLSIMVVGLLCLAHVIRWSALGYTIVGISMIFGSSAIVRGIVSLIH